MDGMRLTTNPTVTGRRATPEQQENGADDLRQVQHREQATFLDLWHLNPGRRHGIPVLELARSLNRLTQEATRIFRLEERYLRQLKPSHHAQHRVAHDRILRELDALGRSLHEGKPVSEMGFDRALTEYLIHCVCSDPSLEPHGFSPNASSDAADQTARSHRRSLNSNRVGSR